MRTTPALNHNVDAKQLFEDLKLPEVATGNKEEEKEENDKAICIVIDQEQK